MNFDIAINNVHIVDGSGKRGYNANIGIFKDKIQEISQEKLSAIKEIDGLNHLIASPGFIDMHSHSDLIIFNDINHDFYQMAALSKISQGITTEIVGQDGYSAGPLSNSNRKEYLTHWSGLTGDFPIEKITWNSIKDYLQATKTNNFPVKIETLVGQSTIRMEIMGYSDRVASNTEIEQMQDLLDQSLKEGAVGMSMGLIYPPGMFAKFDELVALGHIVAQNDKFIVAHIRNESDKVFQSIKEYIEIQNKTNARIHVSHFKICGQKNLSRGDELKNIILNQFDKTQKISFDIYPYDAGSTTLTAILPPWVHDGGPRKVIERLNDSKLRQKMFDDIFSEKESDWDNFIGFSKGGLDGIKIVGAPNELDYIIGKSLKELGENEGFDTSNVRGKRKTFDYICEILVKSNLRLPMISFNQDINNVQKFLQLQGIMTIGTDGVIGQFPHPRLYGAHTKYLNWFINENRFPIEQIIHSITGFPAELLNLDRGIIEPGRTADICIFNPSEVCSMGTYDNPKQISKGIKYVLIDGKITYSDGKIH